MPRLAASGATSLRTQSAIADAIVQRRIAAGLTATLRLSGSTMASSRTRSSPPQPPGPWISGMRGAIAISSVSASRQAEACCRRGGAASAGWAAPVCPRKAVVGLAPEPRPDAASADALGASAGRGLRQRASCQRYWPNEPWRAAVVPQYQRWPARDPCLRASARSASTSATVTIAAPHGHIAATRPFAAAFARAKIHDNSLAQR